MSDPKAPTRSESRASFADRVTPQQVASGRSLSMHEGVTEWCDCCSCEAEPYWMEVAEELGIDPD